MLVLGMGFTPLNGLGKAVILNVLLNFVWKCVLLQENTSYCQEVFEQWGMHIRLGADTPTGMSRLKYCRANSVQCRSLLLGRIIKYGVWYVCVVTDNSAPEPHPPPFPGPAQWALCLAKERSVCWKGVLNWPGCLTAAWTVVVVVQDTKGSTTLNTTLNELVSLKLFLGSCTAFCSLIGRTLNFISQLK